QPQGGRRGRGRSCPWPDENRRRARLVVAQRVQYQPPFRPHSRELLAADSCGLPGEARRAQIGARSCRTKSTLPTKSWPTPARTLCVLPPKKRSGNTSRRRSNRTRMAEPIPAPSLEVRCPACHTLLIQVEGNFTRLLGG